MIRFHCSECGVEIGVALDKIGRRGRCRCGAQFVVPAKDDGGVPRPPPRPASNASTDGATESATLAPAASPWVGPPEVAASDLSPLPVQQDASPLPIAQEAIHFRSVRTRGNELLLDDVMMHTLVHEAATGNQPIRRGMLVGALIGTGIGVLIGAGVGAIVASRGEPADVAFGAGVLCVVVCGATGCIQGRESRKGPSLDRLKWDKAFADRAAANRHGRTVVTVDETDWAAWLRDTGLPESCTSLLVGATRGRRAAAETSAMKQHFDQWAIQDAGGRDMVFGALRHEMHSCTNAVLALFHGRPNLTVAELVESLARMPWPRGCLPDSPHDLAMSLTQWWTAANASPHRLTEAPPIAGEGVPTQARSSFVDAAAGGGEHVREVRLLIPLVEGSDELDRIGEVIGAISAALSTAGLGRVAGVHYSSEPRGGFGAVVGLLVSDTDAATKAVIATLKGDTIGRRAYPAWN